MVHVFLFTRTLQSECNAEPHVNREDLYAIKLPLLLKSLLVCVVKRSLAHSLFFDWPWHQCGSPSLYLFSPFAALKPIERASREH